MNGKPRSLMQTSYVGTVQILSKHIGLCDKIPMGLFFSLTWQIVWRSVGEKKSSIKDCRSFLPQQRDLGICTECNGFDAVGSKELKISLKRVQTVRKGIGSSNWKFGGRLGSASTSVFPAPPSDHLAVVFHWEWFCLPENFWRCLGTVVVVTAGCREGHYWHWVGRGQGCC